MARLNSGPWQMWCGFFFPCFLRLMVSSHCCRLRWQDEMRMLGIEADGENGLWLLREAKNVVQLAHLVSENPHTLHPYATLLHIHCSGAPWCSQKERSRRICEGVHFRSNTWIFGGLWQHGCLTDNVERIPLINLSKQPYRLSAVRCVRHQKTQKLFIGCWL